MRSIRWSVLPAIAFAVACHGTAEAQYRPWEISIGGGPTIPRGDFAELAKTGYHVQASVGSKSSLPVGIRADVLWQELKDEEAEWYRQVGGALNATYEVPLMSIEPYVLAGGSYLRTESPEVAHEGHEHAAESENLLGFHAGAGIEFPFMGLRGFIEGRFLNLLGGDEAKAFQAIPVTFGIRF
jgi:hypothetical protein